MDKNKGMRKILARMKEQVAPKDNRQSVIYAIDLVNKDQGLAPKSNEMWQILAALELYTKIGYADHQQAADINSTFRGQVLNLDTARKGTCYYTGGLSKRTDCLVASSATLCNRLEAAQKKLKYTASDHMPDTSYRYDATVDAKSCEINHQTHTSSD